MVNKLLISTTNNEQRTTNNEQRTTNNLTLNLLLGFMCFLFLNFGFSQSTVTNLSWDINAGCQLYDFPKEREISLEEIENLPCITVCENTIVHYTLSGTFSPNATVTWNVIGGLSSITATTATTSTATVTWGIATTTANISIAVTDGNNTITKTLCFNVVKKPTAGFLVYPNEINEPQNGINACLNQNIVFHNNSSTNGGSNLYSYYWEFGDGTTSQEQNPTHIYDTPNTYTVQLTVTNACGCKDYFKREIKVIESRGFEISCPSAVCENKIQTYSIPVGEVNCNTYNFTVQGGTILNNPNDGTVSVAWNNVDATGFGYLTFNPSECNAKCAIPTTIKIPVIQTIGTITGNASMCANTQGIYTLPQWPATIFNWSVTGSGATVFNPQNNNQIVLNATQSGVVTITCNYTNTLLNCSGTATIQVTIKNPEPINGATTLCVNNVGSYSTATGHLVNWQLTRNNVVVLNTTNSASFSYNFTIAGNYILTANGANVCNDQQVGINVLPVPTVLTLANINEPATAICPLQQTSFSIETANPNMDYEWQVTGGSIAGATIGQSVAITFNQTGPYLVKVRQKAKNTSNCASPWLSITPTIFTIQAGITDTFALPVFTPNPAMGSCGNTSRTYVAITNTAPNTVYAADSYEWSITPAYLGSITSNGFSSVGVQWNNVTAPQTATISVTIKKCTVTQTISRQVVISPPITLTFNATNVCSGNTVTASLSSTNVAIPAGATITWNDGNGNTATQNITTSIPAGTVVNWTTPIYYTNSATFNTDYNITATLNIPQGLATCAGQYVSTKTISVTPGPGASISSNNGYGFCTSQTYTTTLSVATNSSVPNLSKKWYKNGVQVGTGSTYVVNNINTPTTANYYVTTQLGSCTSRSTNTTINISGCIPPPVCTINPNPNITIDKLSCAYPAPDANVCSNCATLSIKATITNPALQPLSENWQINGPDATTTGQIVSSTSLNTYDKPITVPGIYNVFYNAFYTCTDGQIGKKVTQQNITIPYIAKFTKSVNCTNNTITLTDASNFIPTVPASSRTFSYDYKINSGAWTTIAGNSPTVTFNLPAVTGTLYLRQRIGGTLGGVAQQRCEKIESMPISSTTPQSIVATNNSCYNYAIEFTVTQPNPLDISYFWTFDTPPGTSPPIPAQLVTGDYFAIRTFDASFAGTTQVVSVKIKNINGCERTITGTVTIPNRCFFGTITSSAMPICNNGSLTLNYTPNPTTPDNCTTGNTYTWMDGNQQLGTTTVPTKTLPNVTGNHAYWVIVKSNSLCEFSVPNRISPTYKPEVKLVLSLPATVCQGNTSATATIDTDGTNIVWTVDTIPQPAYNNATSLPIHNFALGTHLVSVTASGTNGCSKTVTGMFSIKPVPGLPTVSYEVINCDTYEIKLTANPPAGGTGTLTWSTNTPGSSVIVNTGGPYMVTYNDGSGCNTTAQLFVPHSADKLFWVVPSGCYVTCQENNGYLMGPIGTYANWEWLQNNDIVLSGSNSPIENLNITQSGTYALQIETICPQTTPPLTIDVLECSECPFYIEEPKIGCKRIADTLLAYEMYLQFENPSNFTTCIATCNTTQIAISNTANTLVPGYNFLQFTLIPLNGYSGGDVEITLTCTNSDGKVCQFKFNIKLPDCRKDGNTNKTAEATNANRLQLWPNPTTNKVTVSYVTQQPTNTNVFLFDVTGKLVSTFEVKNNTGTFDINTSNLAKGVYILVLKDQDNSSIQKKLIIE